MKQPIVIATPTSNQNIARTRNLFRFRTGRPLLTGRILTDRASMDNPRAKEFVLRVLAGLSREGETGLIGIEREMRAVG
jgi:hypothetical protein